MGRALQRSLVHRVMALARAALQRSVVSAVAADVVAPVEPEGLREWVPPQVQVTLTSALRVTLMT